MANALSRISNSIFGNRDVQPTMPARTTAPNPGMLGTGLASNAATGLLMHQYRNEVAEAEANGQEYPTFEEWVLMRR